MAWLEERGFTMYLADTDEARPYREVPYEGRTTIVVGNERYGISKPWYAYGLDSVCVPHARSSRLAQRRHSASVLLTKPAPASSAGDFLDLLVSVQAFRP